MGRDQLFGNKVRRLRQQHGLTQTGLAARLEISPSYLNLIEHNQRPLTLRVALRLGRVFDVELSAFSEDEETRLVGDLAEAFADPLFKGAPLEATDLAEWVAASPAACHAVLELYRAFRQARDDTARLDGMLHAEPFTSIADHRVRQLLASIRAFAEILRDYADLDDDERRQFLDIVIEQTERLVPLIDEVRDVHDLIEAGDGAPRRPPGEEAADFLQEKGGFFAPLEEAAEALRRAARLDARPLAGTPLAEHLAARHRVDVAIDGPADGAPRRFDPERRCLVLSDLLSPAERTFELAHQLALLSHGAAIDDCVDHGAFGSEEARALARVALADYVARAMMMPYDPFLEAANNERHDIERLARRFAAGFEHVCHRLTTLRRPDAAGIPFHLIMVDAAGNVIERFSASGLHIARYGGICPLWNAHAAFFDPGVVRFQAMRLPDGAAYVSVARTVERPRGGHHAPRRLLAVELGCDAAHAGRLVYADGLDLDVTAVAAGVTCRMCERAGCAHRAAPHFRAAPKVDENLRPVAPHQYPA